MKLISEKEKLRIYLKYCNKYVPLFEERKKEILHRMRKNLVRRRPIPERFFAIYEIYSIYLMIIKILKKSLEMLLSDKNLHLKRVD